MEKSAGRAFIFSLIILIVLNFLFYIITYAIADMIDIEFNRVAAHPTHFVYFLIYQTHYFPWELISRGIAATFAFTIYFIGGFITFIIAAIVAGFMGGNIGRSLEGWIITAICYMLMHIAIITIDSYNLPWIHQISNQI